MGKHHWVRNVGISKIPSTYLFGQQFQSNERSYSVAISPCDTLSWDVPYWLNLYRGGNPRFFTWWINQLLEAQTSRYTYFIDPTSPTSSLSLQSCGRIEGMSSIYQLHSDEVSDIGNPIHLEPTLFSMRCLCIFVLEKAQTSPLSPLDSYPHPWYVALDASFAYFWRSAPWLEKAIWCP